MKRKILICCLVLGLGVGTVDRAIRRAGSSTTQPTTRTHCSATTSSNNISCNCKRATRKSPANSISPLQMAQFVKNMPARYKALFSQWRNVTSLNTFGNTVSWINGINTGVLPNINTGYHNSTTQLSQYSPYELSGMDASELGRVQSQYASIELSDGANMNAMATIGAIRGSAGTSRPRSETSKTILSRATPTSTVKCLS